MFRVAFMFDPKHAADVLLFLSAIKAQEVEGPAPVQNVSVKDGRIVQRTATGNMADIVYDELLRRDAHSAEPSTIKIILQQCNLSPASAGYVIQQLVASKRLRKLSNRRGLYNIVRKKK